MRSLCALTVLALQAVGTAASAGHAHGGAGDAPEPEWGGKFHLENGLAKWIFCKTENKETKAMEYVDASIIFRFTAGADLASTRASAVEEYGHTDEHINVTHGATMTAGTGHGNTYLITFDDSLTCNILDVSITGAPAGGGDFVFWLQHFPIEFEGDMGHYLKDATWANVEPEEETEAAVEGSDLPKDKRWGYSILASFISGQFIFFGALVWFAMEWAGLDQATRTIVLAVLRAFSSGVLLVVSFVHLNMELNETAIHHGVKMNWKPMCTIAAGGVFGLLTLLVPAHGHGSIVEETEPAANEPAAEGDAEKAQGEIAEKDAELPKTLDLTEKPTGDKLATGYLVNVGDFLCNFTDGVVITSAFWGCRASLGWEVMGAVICHELPGECADFSVLKSAGFKTWFALVSNFISAMAAVLSAIIVSATIDSFGHDVNAYFIAFSMGVLAVVATASFQQFVVALDRSQWTIVHYLAVALSLIIGAVILTSILADFHVHCEPAGGDHAGHNH